MQHIDFLEDNLNISNLEADFIEQDEYIMIHKHTIIVCHDVFIKCEHKGMKGYLLVRRLKQPAKDVLWPIGGRVLRGVPTEESLKRKASDECNLTLENITYIKTARTLFAGEPFGHNKGTDTFNIIFIADGVGDLRLNKLHDEPYIVTQDIYRAQKNKLDPYAQECFEYIEENNLW